MFLFRLLISVFWLQKFRFMTISHFSNCLIQMLTQILTQTCPKWSQKCPQHLPTDTRKMSPKPSKNLFKHIPEKSQNPRFGLGVVVCIQFGACSLQWKAVAVKFQVLVVEDRMVRIHEKPVCKSAVTSYMSKFTSCSHWISHYFFIHKTVFSLQCGVMKSFWKDMLQECHTVFPKGYNLPAP